ncbi:hypothetical protein EHS39_32980 [Ensifer sp. MPMI2T]|nr:hypothetical protein EHS39_32980 [Ensifer sp. MPMI2T]
MNDRLGFTYKDKISGFQGVATGHCEYLTGCSQTLLQPQSLDGGKIVDSHWFDDQRLEKMEIFPRVTLDNGDHPGCDKQAPKR